MKGIYRVKAHYDFRNNDFPRDKEGNLDNSFGDFYIDCRNNIEIYHYGDKELVAYIPSLQRGHNIIKLIKEMGKEDIILKVEESDLEVLIHFYIKDIEIIAELCQCRKNGKNISPFSVKNLPKTNKPKYNKYEIPQENKELYDKMISLLKEWVLSKKMKLGDAYNLFYKEFGKSVKVDLVVESNKTNYKIVHCIEKMGLLNKAVDWLNKNM